MPILLISIFIQVCFIVHIVKTGRSTTWIWIVLMLPLAGAIAYVFLEVLPDISNSRVGRNANRKLQSAINPNKDIKHAASNYASSDTVETSMRLAEACLDRKMYEEAKKLFKKSLSGAYSDDPNLMFGLAKAEFGLGNFEQVKLVLDELIKSNPDYKNAEAHLLYARSLERLGEVDSALHEYEVLYTYYPGPDAAFYFSMFLRCQGQSERADQLLREILSKAENRHFSNRHADIIRQVKNELNGK
ncbi:tetratricopeptide repeat protein [Teredinibacter sp. KSP-S5-2]|uniref:tetratricopeptide repeat protein n=1 Tax=Teredinibacter sp. KSP-S5-2 TaxID=3034506 RepID=UPI002934CD2F|nr:tetratricopeptide repeat protein [Teredinibacter sp. KSP-S5-2]WNO11059.1 tetratricopeptide repeat protein [Teredinibacter sp. KSP-S5-2]